MPNLAQELRDQAKTATGGEQKFLTSFADGSKGYPPPTTDLDALFQKMIEEVTAATTSARAAKSS